MTTVRVCFAKQSSYQVCVTVCVCASPVCSCIPAVSVFLDGELFTSNSLNGARPT